MYSSQRLQRNLEMNLTGMVEIAINQLNTNSGETLKVEEEAKQWMALQ